LGRMKVLEGCMDSFVPLLGFTIVEGNEVED